MSIYMVAYDLNSSRKNYEPLLAAIRAYPHCRALESAFFIETQESARQVRDKLEKYVDVDDELYVLRLKREWAATHKSASADWLMSAQARWYGSLPWQGPALPN